MPLLQTPGPAPDFATHAVVNGNIGHIGLKDYQGEKYVCLVFYPMDFVYAESITPFSNRVEEFNKVNCTVLAMSTDSVYSHKAFVKASRADGGLEGKCKIPLLADRSGKISKKYGVFDAEEGIARKALVIIDDRGTARHMVASSLPVDKVIDDTLKVIQTFQSKSLGSGSGGDVQPSNFPIIKSNTLLLPSMSPERSGRSSRTSRPKLLDSPCIRLLLYLLNLTTNIAVSMLVIGTHTRTSPLFSTHSSRNTTESCPLPLTPLTWTLTRSREMLPAMFQFTLAALGLAVPLMDLVFPPESPRSSVRELRLL
eukprot:TRINITY_DN1780_c0_g1_i5.p1 TRINITY_DN1780_c0_g1~~TRINITY_DN1780_c0_g1_i5.p1  ORF type:complete len:326 (-),score=60.86 TRINITY_DN1780_c0_g1_i5:138-1070(-)